MSNQVQVGYVDYFGDSGTDGAGIVGLTFQTADKGEVLGVGA